jgi:hypothetical protein
MNLAVALILGWNGLVPVQDGVSKQGAHWHMTARAAHGELILGMNVRDFDGWYLSAPLDAREVIDVDHADDIGDQEESLLDGYAYATVASVQVKTATRTLTLHPRAAPKRALKHWPDLKKLRFFVHFFPKDDAPTTVTALDASGKVLVTRDFTSR